MRSKERYKVTTRNGIVSNSIKENSPVTVDTPMSSTISKEPFLIQKTLLSSPAEEIKSKEMSKEVRTTFLPFDIEKDKLKLNANKNPSPQKTPGMSAFQFMKSNQERVKYLRSKITQDSPLPSSNNEGPATHRLNSSSPKERPIDQSINWSGTKRLEGLPTVYSIVKITNIKAQGKRISPEPPPQDHIDSMEKYRNGDVFQCVHCTKCFTTGQALGGHMSRKHSGKSTKYNHKKKIRQTREFERMKLYIAKKKYFGSLGYDYEAMMQTPDGKMKAKTLLNRSKIKRIKSRLTEEEVSNYFKG